MDKGLMKLFADTFGGSPLNIEKIAGAGSNRVYYRLACEGGKTVIGVVGTSIEENKAFISLARHFRAKGLNVPEVISASPDSLCYLQEDLGSVSLYDCLKNGRATGCFSEEEIQLMIAAVRSLVKIQFDGAEGLDFNLCYPQSSMDRESVMFDLNYFKYCFLKLVGTEFNEYRLEHDFKAFADTLLAEEATTFMYRDFQARNVMMKDGQPYFIDFQGGRRGPACYDLASFLWQSSANYPDSLRTRVADAYIDCLAERMPVDRSAFIAKLHTFVLFRTLQVLGAYGYRGLWERKPYFINSIPKAFANLRTLLDEGICRPYPYLEEVLRTMLQADVDALTASAQPAAETSAEAPAKAKSAGGTASALIASDTTYCREAKHPLVVRVFSFSYKKGIPADTSGNGGGYVFDCRATHNPGRYDAYKPLTGLDKPVIDFLEEDGEILTFLESVYRLADFHVARFIERGFTDLMFSCGCTGGRHRSVYSAQHLAEHLNDKFGVEVRICHREQGIESVLEAKNVK